jgi:S-DNA-T family DNA segregation ATPase FtsK/SpoIIIE
MVDRVSLTPAEREPLQAVLRGLKAKVDQWTVGRLALARSLQEPDPPSPTRYPPAPQQSGGVLLHPQQLTGEGKPPEEDFTEIYRALLSEHEGENLFDDEDAFSDALQRHVRRGLELLRTEWTEGTDLSQYLLDQLYYDREAPTDDEQDGAELADRVLRVLGQLGVGADLVAVENGPRLTRLTLQLHQLDDLDRLRRGLSKLAFALGFAEDRITSGLAGGEQKVHLFIPRPPSSWRIVGWPELRLNIPKARAEGLQLPVCVGTNVMGAPLIFDLANAPHLLVGGTTGSGKSMCLHALLLSLLASDEPPELLLIDPKSTEFTAYEAVRNLRAGGVVYTPEAAFIALEDLVTEMNARQEKLNSLDARDITEANARGAKMRRIVAVVDELGDLFLTRRETEGPLIRLAQKARSAGIHLVLATQRPEAATFSGMLRSNIPSRIALTVIKAAESRIILDEGGAESLLMRGDMLVRLVGEPTQRAHGCRIEPSDIFAAVRDR